MDNIVLGSRVKLVSNGSRSVNKVGFVGFVTEVPGDKTVRVSKTTVNDVSQGNWSEISELELFKENVEEKTTKYHAIQNKQTGALFVGSRGTSVFNTKSAATNSFNYKAGHSRGEAAMLKDNPFWEGIVVKLVVV
jgi:hypothetical protein